MKNNIMKNNIILLIVAFVLLIGIGVYLLFQDDEKDEINDVEREETAEIVFEEGEETLEEQTEEMQERVDQEEETDVDEPLDIPYSGRVTDFGDDFLILEQTLSEEGIDVFDEDYEPQTISIRVNVDENTEIVDANDVQYVEVPDEYSSSLKVFEYISNLEEDYQFSAVVESKDSFESDGDEIYADVVNWSCFPLNGM